MKLLDFQRVFIANRRLSRIDKGLQTGVLRPTARVLHHAIIWNLHKEIGIAFYKRLSLSLVVITALGYIASKVF